MSSGCTICNGPNSKLCSTCHSSSYCSTECQKTDWPAHKLLCKTVKTLSPRPDPSFKRAILFPVHAKAPRLIWVEYERKLDFTGMPFEDSKISPLLGDDNPSREIQTVQKNIYRNFTLDHTIVVAARDTFLIDGSKPNKSISHATNNLHGHNWRGPLVLLRISGIGVDAGLYEDITLADFRSAVDYLITYNNHVSEHLPGFQNSPGPNVKGVKICCHGDRKLFGLKPYTAAEVPDEHQIYLSTEVNQISALLGFPLLTRQCPPHQAWKDDETMFPDPHENVPATFLHMDALDPKSPSFGWAPMKWQSNVGTVLVVREDGKDLTPNQMEAICEYCQGTLQSLFEKALATGNHKAVMNALTREKFAIFFEEYKRKRSVQDPSLANLQSLFETGSPINSQKEPKEPFTKAKLATDLKSQWGFETMSLR